MKHIILFLILSGVVLNLSSVVAQRTEHYSLLKFQVENELQIKELLDLGLTLDDSPIVNNTIEVVVDQAELIKLSRTNLKFEIVIEDMRRHYDEHIKKSPEELINLQREMNHQYKVEGFEFGIMGGYYTYDQVVSELDSMRFSYPNLISEKTSLGLSIEGRNIWHVKISDNPDEEEGEPQILYTALHHAREPQGMATVLYFMYYLLENYGKDPQVNYLIENREMYFIPVVNPDGYVYNQTTDPDGGGMWRKNRRLNSDGSYGIDLNRNYGYKWGYDDIGSSSDPTSGEYRGTESFSEPETQAIRDFCESHLIRLCLNYHTYGGVLIHPWNYVDMMPPDAILYTDLASSLTEVNGYRFGPGGSSLGYIFNGGTTDWMYGEQSTKNKIIAMTPEVGPAFWPDPSEIYPLAEENSHANMLLALGDGVITDENSPRIVNISAGKNYAKVGIDSILISAIISNPQINDVTVFTYIDNASKSYIDSVILYDDGTHGDSISGDYVFSRRIIAPPFEDIFNLYGYLQSSDGQTHFISAPDVFTTIGPIVLVDFVFTDSDTLPNHSDYIPILPRLKNNGMMTTANNISIRATNLDSCTQVGYFSPPTYGNIEPGEVAEPNQEVHLLFSNHCPDSIYTQIQIDIFSGETMFWQDTLVIFLQRDPLDIEEFDGMKPITFKFEQNYPNPFNPKTSINYELPITNYVDLSIYNVLGQKVVNLVSQKQVAGSYQVEWDASGFASGIYYYKIETGEFVDVKKMIVIK